MKKIAVLGQHKQAFELANDLAKDDQNQVQVFTPENCAAFDEYLLPQFIAGDVQEKELYLTSDANNIEWVQDKQVTRVNFAKQKLHANNRQQFDFDELFVTDTPSIRLPEMKGVRREGVFHLKRLEIVKALMSQLAFSDVSIIQVEDSLSLLTAFALQKRGQEVIAVFPQDNILPDVLDEDLRNAVKQSLETNNIRSIFSETIQEVLGENQVKAVKLSSGKIFAADIVILNVAQDLRIFRDEDKELDSYKKAFDSPLNKEASIHALQESLSQYA